MQCSYFRRDTDPRNQSPSYPYIIQPTVYGHYRIDNLVTSANGTVFETREEAEAAVAGLLANLDARLEAHA